VAAIVAATSAGMSGDRRELGAAYRPSGPASALAGSSTPAMRAG